MSKLTKTKLIPPAINFLNPTAPRTRSAIKVIPNDPMYSAAAFNPFSDEETPFCSKRMDRMGSNSPWLSPAAIVAVIRIMKVILLLLRIDTLSRSDTDDIPYNKNNDVI